jgi:uncharacterized protein (DUF1810 family)
MLTVRFWYQLRLHLWRLLTDVFCLVCHRYSVSLLKVALCYLMWILLCPRVRIHVLVIQVRVKPASSLNRILVRILGLGNSPFTKQYMFGVLSRWRTNTGRNQFGASFSIPVFVLNQSSGNSVSRLLGFVSLLPEHHLLHVCVTLCFP